MKPSKKRKIDLSLPWNHRIRNPHCDQVFSDNSLDLLHNIDSKISFERILAPNAPSAPYRRRRGEKKTSIHWGQRKLLLSEIEFLSIFISDLSIPYTVVYAGAAPGKHISYLSKLFPNLEFYLIDPNSFSVKETDKIHIYSEFFTDAIAKRFSNRNNVFFISDIRTASPKMTESESEARIEQDMNAQSKWHTLMKPIASMLKFRPLYYGKSTVYLHGDIYLPVWGPQTTTETRLIVKSDSINDIYDNEKYGDQMFYFNTVTRTLCFREENENIVQLGVGLDHCYDCTAEIHILRNYLKRFYTNIKEEEIHLRIIEMSSKISRFLSSGKRTLADPQPHPRHRHLEEKETICSRNLPTLLSYPYDE